MMPDIVGSININEQLLSNINSLPDNVRKELRLLGKQYEIIRTYQKSPTICENLDGRIFRTKEQPFIIEYKHFGNNDEIFEWVIKPERLR